MVVWNGFVRLRQLLAVPIDLGCGPNPPLGHRNLHIVGPDLNPSQWHERQMAGDDDPGDRGELVSTSR